MEPRPIAFALCASLALIVLLVLPMPLLADVAGGGFDGMPVGPYPFGPGDAELLQGNPNNVQIVPAGQEQGAPPVPGGMVHVDAGGVYNNPDDVWSPPVVSPPSTTFGSNTEGVGVCDGSGHTIAFIILPGTVVYLDNFTTVCETGTVSTDAADWGRIKAMYR